MLQKWAVTGVFENHCQAASLFLNRTSLLYSERLREGNCLLYSGGYLSHEPSAWRCGKLCFQKSLLCSLAVGLCFKQSQRRALLSWETLTALWWRYKSFHVKTFPLHHTCCMYVAYHLMQSRMRREQVEKAFVIVLEADRALGNRCK